MKDKKIALVLSGGGFKGMFQVGVLDYLHEKGVKFDHVSGVSVGALNGSFVAMNKFDQLKEFWNAVIANGYTEIYSSDFMSVTDGKFSPNYDKIWETIKPKASVWDIASALFSKKKRNDLILALLAKVMSVKAIANNKPLKDKLAQYVKLKDFQVPFSCGLVSLTSGSYYTATPDKFDSDLDYSLAIAASATMPIVWEPIEKIQTKNELILNSVDGGIRNISPLGDTVDFINNDEAPNNEWTIVIVNCTSGKIEKLSSNELNIATIAGRVFDGIVLNEIFNDDIREFINTNEFVKQAYPQVLYNKNGKRMNYFNYVIIQPEEFELGDTLDSSVATLNKRYAIGQKIAKDILDKYELI
jgi:NTE family protein